MDWRMIAAVVACTTLVATSMLVQREMGLTGVLQRLAYAMFPASQLLTAVVLFMWIIQLGLSNKLLVLVCIAAIACCPVDIALFRKLKQAQDRKFAEIRVNLLSEQLRMQELYNAKLKNEMTNICRIRIDAEQEFAKAAELVARDPSWDIDKAFEGVQAAMGAVTLRYCENPVVDVIVDAKHAECVEAEVDMSLSLDVPRYTPSIPDVELCAVFANLLDNALEAAKRSSESGLAVPFVELVSKVQGNTLTVSTKNSVPEDFLHDEVAKWGKKPKAHKSFRGIDEHGWGLTIVEDIVARHGGALVTSVDGNTFNTSAMLVYEGMGSE